MTPIDLRIKYKLETGCYPIANYSVFLGNDDRYFTNEYGEWLETKQYPCIDIFLRHTGKHGTFYNSHKDEMHYTQEYKEWLENRYCNTMTCKI